MIRRTSLKAKKCRICFKVFMPVRSMQKICGPECAAELVRQEKERDAARAKRIASKEHRAALERLKTRSEHLRELQVVFNTWIRLRDAGQPCISCGRHHKGKWNAGHYLSIGARPELRFEPSNVHLQCEPCNTHLSGNLIPYRVNLIRKVGLDRVLWLEGPHEPLKITVPEIMAMKEEYRAKIRELKKQVEVNQTLEVEHV